MKAQIYNTVKKQLTIVLMMLSYITCSYAQKSAIALNEAYNLKQLKSLVEMLNNKEMDYFTPELPASNAFMIGEEEEELVIEDWMLDEAHFRLPVNEDELYEAAEEEKPVIEDWMLDPEHWVSRAD